MPKKEIDYSNTIIYKITCKDLNINDIYVGHTTNFVQRKHTHKQSCNNIKNINHKCKLYQIIRGKGGWDNWNMSMIDLIQCTNGNEARQKEQEYYEKLNANLNSNLNSIEPFIIKENKSKMIKPLVEKKIYYCELCNIYTSTQKQLINHYSTFTHKKENVAEIIPKLSCKFECKTCKYKTMSKKDYNKHILTTKHKNTTKYNKNTTENPKIPVIGVNFSCICGKSYPYRGSLYNHKKKCIYKEDNGIKIPDETDNKLIAPNNISKDLILKLVEENSEIKNLLFKQFDTMQKQMHEQQTIMQNQISELIPKVGNNNTVTNKQKFNINIFLNEQCKDALTIDQFINNIEVTLPNLLVTKNKGLCEGVSNIFIENMNKLSLYERPMHCTDSKRDIMYIKSESKEVNGIPKWEKDEENKKLKQAIKTVTHVQQKNICKWEKEHPNWQDNSDEQIEYMTIVKHCTDELSENNKEDKLIKKICNKVHLNMGKGEILTN